MARLWTSGGEWNDATAEGLTSLGTPSFTTSNVRTGTHAYRSTDASSVWRWAFTGVLGITYYARQYIRIDNLPGAGVTQSLGGFLSTDGFSYGLVHVTETGALRLFQKGVLSQQGSDSTSLVVAGTYFMLEQAITIGSGAVDYIEARLNGVSFASGSGLSLTDSALNEFRFTNAGNIAGSTVDDIAINDSTGVNQNTWPGPGNVVLLVPTSDNAKGTGWTNDAAATTNLFDAVNNEPPVGIADTTTGSGLHQLRNATSNANVNYDANMTTYLAAGMGTRDIVQVVVPVIATAAPVTTSSKQGTVGVVSNPAIANVALGAGGTAGAFWSGVAAGTYPTGWKWSFGTTTYNPSVTPGTAPVMRITQVTSSTRVAMVCAMGMYVEYRVYRPSLVKEHPNRRRIHALAAMSRDRW